MNIAKILEVLRPGIVIGEQGSECSIAMGADGVPYIETWNRADKPPTPEELKAAEPAALAAQQAEAVKVAESTTARDDAKRALTALDTIIGGIDGATLAQAKTAIKQLAQIQRNVILAALGR